MQKAYNRNYWKNYPSDVSPINDTNLNNIEVGVDEIDNRVIGLDTTKFDKTEAQGLFKDVSLDRATGIITFTLYSGATKTIDTLLEKIAVNFDYDVETQQLIIILDDGTIKYINLSALITQYEFLDSDTIAFAMDNEGKVSAIVKEGSIEDKHLRPDYLADIKVETAKAQASQAAAATSEANALASENAAKASETNAKASEKSANSSASTATAQAAAAKDSATAAATSATNAAGSENAAKLAETNAKTSETNSKKSETNAASSASTATSKASAASTSAANAADSATEAESYAHGGTGTRDGEDVDNARYYKEQAERISQGLAGGLMPMGTVTFELLKEQTKNPGYMYNISDSFTTTDEFKEGAGYEYAPGTNVYWTADGYWDCLAGTSVAGIMGSVAEVTQEMYDNLSEEEKMGNTLWAISDGDSGNGDAIAVDYDNATSGLAATNVQDAIDEVNSNLLTNKFREAPVTMSVTDFADSLPINSIGYYTFHGYSYNNVLKLPIAGDAYGYVYRITPRYTLIKVHYLYTSGLKIYTRIRVDEWQDWVLV